MAALGDRAESALRRIRFRVAAALAAALYAGGLGIPLTRHWATPLLILYSVIPTLSAGLVLFGWYDVRIEDAHRRHLVDWTTNLRLLDAEEFEWFVGEIFRREGYQVKETGSQEHPDGNIDLVLTRNGSRTIVQCKRWQSWEVGVDEIRKFAGTLLREGLNADAGIFVTLSSFRDQARREAEKMGLTLVNGKQLESRWESVRRIEPCPACGQPMRIDKSTWGWWLRCVAPGCKGKRDLGAEPGRALELLTRFPA
ncbi:MAG: restriction endonuclease [Acidimicrobiales bacterium]